MTRQEGGAGCAKGRALVIDKLIGQKPGKRERTQMKTITALGTTALIVCSGLANGAIVDVQRFNLFNHPSGAIDPQLYGLRLDSFVDPSEAVTFSFEDRITNDSNVQLIVREFDNGTTTIQIVGEVWGNSAASGSFFGTFALDVTYTVETNPGSADGWVDPDAGPNDIGSLTQLTDDNGDPFAGIPLVINTRSDAQHGNPFVFLQDGYRISGDNSTWVGRGWVQDAGTTNDFLFTAAAVVPIPTAAMAGLMGLLTLSGVHANRRRR